MSLRIVCFSVILLMTAASFGQTNQEKERILQPDTPLKILFKPRAAYPIPKEGTICMQGTVTLRVEFLSSGTIGKIVPITKLPYGATENAIEAAKKMKFKPAMKAGNPITVVRLVQFGFGIY